jgi:protein-S-isoprenylcysteine O-methyltransferase Ste14
MTAGWRIAGAFAAGGAMATLLALAARLGGGADPAAVVFIGLMSLAAAVEAGLSAGAGDIEAVGAAAWPRRLAAATGAWLFLLAATPLALGWRAGVLAPAGVVLMLAGLGLRAGALAQLGARYNSTNVIADDATLERRGLYRGFAHPSELGLLLLAGGGLLLTAPAAALLALAPLYALTLARLAHEERALAARHGDAWRRYRASTLDPMPVMTGRHAE